MTAIALALGYRFGRRAGADVGTGGMADDVAVAGKYGYLTWEGVSLRVVRFKSV
jgi:hypothetical protein